MQATSGAAGMGSLQQPVLTKGSAFPMKRSGIIGFPHQIKLNLVKPCIASPLEGSLVTGRPPFSVSVPIPEIGVAGNFHFAPGKSFQQSGVDAHDLLAFQKDSLDISHKIDRLTFGEYLPDVVNPLDSVQWTQETPSGMYQYFIKPSGPICELCGTQEPKDASTNYQRLGQREFRKSGETWRMICQGL